MDLIANLWRYRVRYLGWVVLSIVASVIYAATVPIMVSLIEPIFNEVLPAGVEMPAVVSMISAPDEGAEVASPALFNVYGQLQLLYENLKKRFGIGPDTVLFFVPILFFVVFLLRTISLSRPERSAILSWLR